MVQPQCEIVADGKYWAYIERKTGSWILFPLPHIIITRTDDDERATTYTQGDLGPRSSPRA